MKFSLAVPRPTDEPSTAQIDAMRETARYAERQGFNAVSCSDHPFPLVVPGQAGHQVFDPFVLHSFIASATETIGLHFSLIVNGYRNPFLTARMLATLDQLSGGRVIAGIGAGYLHAEFDALGGAFDGRGTLIDESVAAMKAAWTGEPVHASGAGWLAAGNTMLPRPAREPHPIMWIGGNSERSMRRAVKDFDGWCPFEVNEIGAKQTTTRAVGLDNLGEHVARFTKLVEESERDEPIDICYVRTSRRWLSTPATIVEQLEQLEQLGITWLEFTVPGSEMPQITEDIDKFVEAARSSRITWPE